MTTLNIKECKAFASQFSTQIRKDTTVCIQYFTLDTHQCNEKQKKKFKKRFNIFIFTDNELTYVEMSK